LFPCSSGVERFENVLLSAHQKKVRERGSDGRLGQGGKQRRRLLSGREATLKGRNLGFFRVEPAMKGEKDKSRALSR